jgi:hypothetical protein
LRDIAAMRTLSGVDGMALPWHGVDVVSDRHME